MSKKTKFENTIVVAAFVLAIGVLSIATVYSCCVNKTGIAVTENRIFAPFPGIHTLRKDLPLFAGRFEAFYNDRMAFRVPMITFRNLLALKLLHSSGNHLIALGRHGWLFYNDGYGVTRAQLNSDPFDQEELLAWGRSIQARSDFCKAHHIKYLLVIPPEKGTIYPEQMPNGWERQPGPTRLEQLQAYLRRHTDVDFVDAQSILKQKKAQTTAQPDLLYFTSDSHWNDLGASCVAKEILSHVSADVASVRPIKNGEFHMERQDFTGDLANMLSLRTQIMDKNCPFLWPNTPGKAVQDLETPLPSFPTAMEPARAFRMADSSLPRALVLRDSYCSVLMRFLADRFGFIEYQWTNMWMPGVVLKEKPDVVINEIAERHLSEEFFDHVPMFLTGKTERRTLENPEAQVAVNSAKDAEAAPLITFGDKFELLSMTAQQNSKGLLLKLLWRAKKPVQLDDTVGVHCLGAADSLIGGSDYGADILQRRVDAGATWLDSVEIPTRALGGNPQKIGILRIQKTGDVLLSTDSAGQPGGARFAVSIKDLQKNQSGFEKTYIASGGTLPI